MEQNETFLLSKRENWEGLKSTDTEGLGVISPTEFPPVLPFSSCSPRAATSPAPLLPGRRGGAGGVGEGKGGKWLLWDISSLFGVGFRMSLPEMRCPKSGSSCLLLGRRETWIGLNGGKFFQVPEFSHRFFTLDTP